MYIIEYYRNIVLVLMLHTVTFHREKRRLKILAWNDSCDFRATRRRNNTVASEYIPGEKIRLGIEITCLAAIRYRFNSITCFLFIRRFRSHDCFSHRLVSFSFSTLILRARYRMTRSGPWPWKFLCFTRTSMHGRARVLPTTTSPLPRIIRMEPARGKGEIFESDDQFFFMARLRSRYPSEWANRVSSLLNRGASWCMGRIDQASQMTLKYIL